MTVSHLLRSPTRRDPPELWLAGQLGEACHALQGVVAQTLQKQQHNVGGIKAESSTLHDFKKIMYAESRLRADRRD